jgi:hypothetical protein
MTSWDFPGIRLHRSVCQPIFAKVLRSAILGEAVSSSLIVEGRNVIITEVVERAATKEILAKTKPLK